MLCSNSTCFEVLLDLTLNFERSRGRRGRGRVSKGGK
jgi:hypothetical protein